MSHTVSPIATASNLLLAVLPGLFRSLARFCRRVGGLVGSVDSPLFRFACALRRLTRLFGERTCLFGRPTQTLVLLPDFLCKNPQLLGCLPIHLARYAKQFGAYARDLGTLAICIGIDPAAFSVFALKFL